MLRFAFGLITSIALATPAVAEIKLIPLNSTFDGQITDPTNPVAFVFDGIEGIKISLVIDGVNGLKPLVRVLDASGTQVVAVAETTASGHAELSAFVPPASGQYIVEVSGSAAGPVGGYKGTLKGKIPKSMKSAAFPPNSAPGESIGFFALAGTKLSGTIRIHTKPHPFNNWFAIIGPSGPVSTAFKVTYSGFNKYATFKNVVLPDTGNYVLGPSQSNFVLSGKVTLKPLKGGNTVIHLGDEPFLPSLPEPKLDPLAAATAQGSVTVSGSAAGATQVEIVAHPAVVVADVVGGAFSTVVSLVPNSRNVIFVTGLADSGARSLPAVARVVQDSEPPSLQVLTPIANATLVGTAVHVSGVAGDRLTPELPVTVTVNALPASVESDFGVNGSFERRDVPLGASGTTNFTVVATDGLGNQATKVVPVTKGTIIGVPILTTISGDGQSAPVGTEVPLPLTVRLMTAAAVPFSGKLVEFKVTRGDGRLGTSPGFASGTNRLLVVSDANGFASVYFRTGSDAGFGANRVTISSVGLTGVSEFSFPTTGLPANRLAAVAGSAQAGPAGAQLPGELVVRATDGRNPVANATVHFRVATGGGELLGPTGGDGGSAITDAQGIARAVWRLGSESDAQRVIAVLDGAPAEAAAVSFDARATVASIAQSTSIGGVVHDVFHRSLAGATVTVFLNGVLVGTANTAADGRFSFQNLASGGVVWVVVDGTTVNLVDGAGGQGLPPEVPYGSAVVRDVLIARGAATVLPMPVLLPALDEGKSTYDGSNSLVFANDIVEDFKLKLNSGTTVTLPNGATVPGGAGSIAIGAVTISSDVLPAPVPDGRAVGIGLFVDPPLLRFDPPLPLELPNLLGLEPGDRAALLQYDGDTGRFEIAAELSVSGKLLVTDGASGLSRSGFACVAALAGSHAARVDCAGIALHDLADAIERASSELDHDVEHADDIENDTATLSTAVDDFAAEVAVAIGDATISSGEWSILKTQLGKVEAALFVVAPLGTNHRVFATAAGFDDLMPYISDEAANAGCSAESATAAADASDAFASGLGDVFVGLDSSVGARATAVESTLATLAGLKVLLAATSPPPDAPTKLATRSAQLSADSTALVAATSDLLALLGTHPEDEVAPVAGVLSPASDALPGVPELKGGLLRCAGQIAFASDRGGVNVRGLAVDGVQHAVTVIATTTATIKFGRGAPFVPEASAPAIASELELAPTPPPTVKELVIVQQPLEVAVGGSTQIATSSQIVHGPQADLTAGSTGTSYRTSNPALFTVSPDGLIGGAIPGAGHVTATHLGYASSRRVTAIGNHVVTVHGIALFSNNSPAGSAAVTTSIGASTTTAADGSFAFDVNVPSAANSFLLTIASTFFGTATFSVSTFTVDASGPVDAGIVKLSAVGNLLIGKTIFVTPGSGSVNGTLALMCNGFFLPAGLPWNISGTVWWTGFSQAIEVDLGVKHLVSSANFQGDANDSYLLEAFDSSTNSWKLLWDIPNVDSVGSGLQSRPNPANTAEQFIFPAAIIVTKVRIRAEAGNNDFSCSELQLFGVPVN